MNARISPQYLEGSSRQGRMMIQVLVLSAQGLVAAAQRSTAADSRYTRDDFTRMVRQLMAQRQMAAEILDDEPTGGAHDYEAANLRQALENVCREAELKVLAVQARLARSAGEEELAARIERLLAELCARHEQGWDEPVLQEVPWVDPAASAA